MNDFPSGQRHYAGGDSITTLRASSPRTALDSRLENNQIVLEGPASSINQLIQSVSP